VSTATSGDVPSHSRRRPRRTSGAVRRTTFPPEDERSTFPRFQGQTFAQFLRVAEQLKQVAADKGLTLVQLAIAWQLRLPAITCVLVGAKSPQQVAEYSGAVGVTFTPEELARIEMILQEVPDKG